MVVKIETMKFLSAIPTAIATSGFWKAFFYSFGSWLFGWLITFLTYPEAHLYLGKFGFIIPLINVIAVFFKQYFDALQE